jgi:hypothetical protein
VEDGREDPNGIILILPPHGFTFLLRFSRWRIVTVKSRSFIGQEIIHHLKDVVYVVVDPSWGRHRIHHEPRAAREVNVVVVVTAHRTFCFVITVMMNVAIVVAMMTRRRSLLLLLRSAKDRQRLPEQALYSSHLPLFVVVVVISMSCAAAAVASTTVHPRLIATK